MSGLASCNRALPVKPPWATKAVVHTVVERPSFTVTAQAEVPVGDVLVPPPLCAFLGGPSRSKLSRVQGSGVRGGASFALGRACR